MRELGFSQLWPKLAQDKFTTFRFTRRDKDWREGEVVRVVYKPRTHYRSVLGQAVITSKAVADINHLTLQEIKADGFSNRYEMAQFLRKGYGSRLDLEPMNKITLMWIQRWTWQNAQFQHPVIAAQWAALLEGGAQCPGK